MRCIHPSICRNARADLHGTMCQKCRPLHARMRTSDIQRGLACQKNESSARKSGPQRQLRVQATAFPTQFDAKPQRMRLRRTVQATTFPTQFDARRLKPTCRRRDFWHTGARNPASGTSGVQPTRNLTHTDPPMHRFSTGGQNATHKKGRRRNPLQPSLRTEDSGGIRFEPARLRRAHLLRKTDSANEICLSPSTGG